MTKTLTIKDVEAKARAILSRMGLAHLPKIEVDETGDPSLSLDGGVYVQQLEGEATTICGKTPCVEFEVGTVSYDPGVHRYPDGSGQPPSTDLVPDGEPLRSPRDAARRAICLWLEHEVELALESLEMEDMARDEDEWQKELAQMDADQKLHPTTGEEG